jgi:hypothetical protein
MAAGKGRGAGRPRGSANQKTRDIANRAIADGITPLEVMLRAMREHCDADPARWDQAAAIAKDAAPYIHPRLAAIEHSGKGGGPVQIMIAGADKELL